MVSFYRILYASLLFLFYSCNINRQSEEIINAFKVVDNSLYTSNRVINASTQTIMASFQERLSDPASANRARIWMPKAERAVYMSKALIQQIDELKEKIKIRAGYDPQKPEEGFEEDNMNAPKQIMDKKGEGKKLYEALEKYINEMLAIDREVGELLKNSISIQLYLPKTNEKEGKAVDFNQIPTAAALTILSKFQNDIKTTENKFVNEFHNRVGQVVIPF